MIDGQHRTHAAALRGIEKVPCQIVLADQAMQAKAFAGMNGNQAIRLAPFQVHRAALAAGDGRAHEVHGICTATGVTITSNLPSSQMERGDTVAVRTLYKAVKQFGAPTLRAALNAICNTGEGNVGLVNALAIMAYASAFDARQDLRDNARAMDALDDFDLAAEIERARRSSAKGADQRGFLSTALVDFLDMRLTPAAAAGEAA